jgi:TonB family protein
VFIGAVQAQTTSAPEPSQWQRYTVKGEEFSVILPSVPAMMTEEVLFVPRDNKKRVERTLMITSGGVFYRIFARENVKPEQSLADFISEQTAKYRPGTTTEQAVEINGFAGTEQRSLDANRKTIALFLATKKHLYEFRVNGADKNNTGVKQFFASIMPGKQPEGIQVSDGPGVLEATPADEKTYSRTEVDTKPRIINKIIPQYTEQARLNKITGTVVLKVLLSATGQVTRISVVSGLPYGLTEKCIAYSRMIEFTPAIKDGKPVSMWLDVEYGFRLY